MDEARKQRWQTARRILCVRTDNLGDLLMTTPAIRALKRAAPGRRIGLLASRSGAAAARHLDDVDEVHVYDAPWAAHPADAGPAADAQLIEQLRAARYDAAVIFTVFSQSPLPAALLLRLAGIPLVAAHCRENPYRLLSDWQRETELGMPGRHEVQRQLDLVAALGARCADTRLAFRVDPSDRARLAAMLVECGIAPGRPWVLVHPGATAASRRYPPELFAEALQLLQRRCGLPIVFGGTPQDCELVDAIGVAARLESCSLAGLLTLGECAAAVESASLLIANNSGPVHLAAALGTPVVDLYALTNPQHTPWQVAHRVLSHDVDCRWCFRSVCASGHHACLRGIAPQAVADAAGALLIETGATAAAAA